MEDEKQDFILLVSYYDSYEGASDVEIAGPFTAREAGRAFHQECSHMLKEKITGLLADHGSFCLRMRSKSPDTADEAMKTNAQSTQENIDWLENRYDEIRKDILTLEPGKYLSISLGKVVNIVRLPSTKRWVQVYIGD